MKIPKTIGKYTLIREIKNMSKFYRIAEYTDGDKFYIGKIWLGYFKNKAYFQLLKEYAIYNQLSSKNSNSIKKEFEINVLSPVEIYKTPTMFMFLTEKIFGHDLTSFSIERKLEIYKAVLRYLNNVKFSPEEIKEMGLPVYGYIKFYLFYILINLISFFKHPNLFEYTFLNLKRLINPSFFLSIKKQGLNVVHRDLDDTNIIVEGNRIFIMDFQLAAFTFEFLDVANIYYSLFQKKLEGKDVLIYFAKTIDTHKFSKIYKTLLNFPMIYDLSLGGEKTESFAKEYIREVNAL